MMTPLLLMPVIGCLAPRRKKSARCSLLAFKRGLAKRLIRSRAAISSFVEKEMKWIEIIEEEEIAI
jgi:hypothetical protein